MLLSEGCGGLSAGIAWSRWQRAYQFHGDVSIAAWFCWCHLQTVIRRMGLDIVLGVASDKVNIFISWLEKDY